MESQLATIRATRPTTAAITRAIGPMEISHAAAMRAAWIMACAPMATHEATTVAAVATALAPWAIHPARIVAFAARNDATAPAWAVPWAIHPATTAVVVVHACAARAI